MDDPASFGRVLRAYRTTHDLTQEQLAEQVHCSIETIKKLEAGKLRPSKHLAEALAQRRAQAHCQRRAAARQGRSATGAETPRSGSHTISRRLRCAAA